MSGWGNSTRRSRLPSDWPRIRARILRRDPTCRIAGPHCTGPSTEVDHVRRGDDHHDANLQGACSTCHQAKTLSERRAPRARPKTKHPGLL